MKTYALLPKGFKGTLPFNRSNDTLLSTFERECICYDYKESAPKKKRKLRKQRKVKDNRQIAWITVKGFKTLACIDIETLKAYEVIRGERTYIHIPKYTFIRWVDTNL